MERKPRAIRLNEQEWEGFKALLGTEWLRSKIASAIQRQTRKPTDKRVEE